MILHFFVGDLYLERFPQALKFLKLVVKLDECREHGIASDLYLSDNIVRFNQTIHFPVGDDESTVINELEVLLYSVQQDSEESLLGFSKFVCTSGEHSITKTINLHDSRGVQVGKVPVTSFYYKSAIKLGDRVMFKPRYEPNAKEYSFLLSRRFRQPSKALPVTFNNEIEHRLDNEARDLIARDFKIVSSNKVAPKKVTTKQPVPSNTAAKDSMTYNPGMTRNGAMSDAARGRVVPGQATQKKVTKKAAAPPKLRETRMSVGYVKDSLWPERNTGEAERNLYRLQQASQMKLQLLNDIAMNVKIRNKRTQARQDAIKKKKLQVEVEEGKLKKVLARKESEIQLLKGTLTHLRMTNAMRGVGTPAGTGAGTGASSARASVGGTPSSNHFSRLQHLLYPNPNDSSLRRASTPRSALSGGARRSVGRSRSTPVGSISAGRSRRSELGVSFNMGDETQQTVPVLYHPISTGPSPYDSRKRPFSAPTYRAPRDNKATSQHQEQPQRRSMSKAELVDQLSEIFEENDYSDAYGATQDGTSYRNETPGESVAPSKSIAKDWLASARASINSLHRPNHRSSTSPAATRSSPLKSTRSPEARSGLKSTARPGAAPRPLDRPTNQHTDAAVTAQDKLCDSENDTGDDCADARKRHAQAAPPSFLNSLVEAHHYPGAGGYQDPDTTVSSIAVADIPFIPTAPVTQKGTAKSPKVMVPKVHRESPMRPLKRQTEYFQETVAAASAVPAQLATGTSNEVPSPSYSAHSSDSLDDLSARQKHDSSEQEQRSLATTGTTANIGTSSRPGPENIANLQKKPVGSGANLGPSSRVSRQLEKNKKYAESQGQSAQPRPRSSSATSSSSTGAQVSGSATESQHQHESRAARTASAPSTRTGTGRLDDFAKNKFSIRYSPDSDDQRHSASIPASTGVNRRTIAHQLEKNRQYQDHSLSHAGHRISNGAIEESSRNVASGVNESMHAGSDGEEGTGLDYSLSAALKQDLADVSNTVESLQVRFVNITGSCYFMYFLFVIFIIECFVCLGMCSYAGARRVHEAPAQRGPRPPWLGPAQPRHLRHAHLPLCRQHWTRPNRCCLTHSTSNTVSTLHCGGQRHSR